MDFETWTPLLGGAIGVGLLVGGLVALFNGWKV